MGAYRSRSQRLQQVIKEGPTSGPVTQTAIGIDMAGCTDLDEPAAPIGCASFRIVDGPERIVAAGDHQTAESKHA